MKGLLDWLNIGWETVQELINNGSLVELEYQGKKFYARKILREHPGENPA